MTRAASVREQVAEGLFRAPHDLAIRQITAGLVERSLPHFLERAWPIIEPNPYVASKHIYCVAEHLAAVTRGEIRKLLINIPPRTSKSTVIAVAWPAWTWAQPLASVTSGPGAQFLFGSYAQTLSARDSTKCRRIVESAWYRRHFGDRVQLRADQNAKLRFDTNQGGYRLSTSVDGSLTGEGGGIIVVDDPHNVADIGSDVMRESTLHWWDEAMSTRLNDPQRGAYVVVMQRLHHRDLTGHILAKEHGWTHICLPMRYEREHPHVFVGGLPWQDADGATHRGDWRTRDGELLAPERFPRDTLADMEQTMGPYVVAGQMQQRPVPREGGMFKRQWFEIVAAAPPLVKRGRAWDFAATEPDKVSAFDPDWTEGLAGGISAARVIYLTDLRSTREGPDGVELLLVTTSAQDGRAVTVCLPQDPGQAGKSQVRYFAKQLMGHDLVWSTESGSKTNRARPVAAQAAAGNIKLVAGDLDHPPVWIEKFLNQIELFPMGDHDDVVDALSRLFDFLVLGFEAPAAGPVAVPLVSPYAI